MIQIIIMQHQFAFPGIYSDSENQGYTGLSVRYKNNGCARELHLLSTSPKRSLVQINVLIPKMNIPS